LKRLRDFAARRDLPKPPARKFKPSTFLALLLDLPPCAIRLPGAKFGDVFTDIARENQESLKLEGLGARAIAVRRGIAKLQRTAGVVGKTGQLTNCH
jgi:hypothetical protein